VPGTKLNLLFPTTVGHKGAVSHFTEGALTEAHCLQAAGSNCVIFTKNPVPCLAYSRPLHRFCLFLHCVPGLGWRDDRACLQPGFWC
jgi:hypothetical protein